MRAWCAPIGLIGGVFSNREGDVLDGNLERLQELGLDARRVKIHSEGKRRSNIAEIARDLELTESALRNWVAQAEVDAGQGPAGALTTSERDELTRAYQLRQVQL